MSSLENYLFRTSSHFFFLLACLFWYWAERVVCVFWSLISRQSLLYRYFLHSLGCLFVLFMVSFAMLKLLSLIRSYLFIFVLIFITLEGWSEKILLWFMSESVRPMFSSKSFIVSGLIFRPLIHFEFIFVYDVRACSNSILLHVGVQFSQHLLKRLSFLVVYSCLLCHRLVDHRGVCVCVFISGLSILFHWPIFLYCCCDD